MTVKRKNLLPIGIGARFIYSAFIYTISATLVFAQSAALLPNALQTYFDANGNPLSTGTVGFYYPSTLNLKPIWQDAAEATPYTNPVTLNAAGQPPSANGIYGQGAYRQIVKDVNGNTIWDAVTSSAGSSSGTAATGDGDLVGTVKPWAGITAPNQYQFAYGQQLNRTTFAALFTAITLSTAVTCTSASNTLSGIADTTSIPIGAHLELAACVTPGTTVSSKTASTVIMSNPSSVSLNTTAVFFPFGNGDGSTTFTLPDFRGNVIAGRPNMGGTASTNLTNAFCANPTAQGAVCGAQSETLARANLPNITYSPVFTGTLNPAATVNVNQSVLGITGSATINSGVNLNVNTITATVTVPAFTPAGTINTFPLNGGITQTAVPTVQPTITLNYIIKVTPDTNSAIATGVTDINGMIGSIACGAGLNCTGNTISVGTAQCTTSGAFLIYNATSSSTVCSTTGGTGSIASLNGTLYVGNGPSASASSQFFVNNSADDPCCGALLNMQKGITGTLYAPNNNANVISLQTLIDSTASGLGRSFIGLAIDAHMQAGTDGTIVGGYFNAVAELAWNPATPGSSGATGSVSIAKSTVGGGLFGSNPYAWCQTVACSLVVGIEADTDNRVNGTNSKHGIQIVDVATSVGTVTGLHENIGMHILKQTGALGWEDAIRVGDVAGPFPLLATGSIISSTAGTITNGIDLSSLTITGNAFVSTSYTVTGAGAVTAANLSAVQFLSAGFASANTGQVRLIGLTSGQVTIQPQAVAGTFNFNLPITAGTTGTYLASQGGGSTAMSWVIPTQVRYCSSQVDFNVGTTDTALSLPSLPTTRYVVNAVRIGNATASLSTSTLGVFTSTGGGGVTMAANQPVTVTATATDTNNNTMPLTLTNAPTTAFNDTTVQIRVGTPEGIAAKADVCIYVVPL